MIRKANAEVSSISLRRSFVERPAAGSLLNSSHPRSNLDVMKCCRSFGSLVSLVARHASRSRVASYTTVSTVMTVVSRVPIGTA